MTDPKEIVTVVIKETVETASIAMNQVISQKIVTNLKKREMTEADKVTEVRLTWYALTVKRFAVIWLKIVQNHQREEITTEEDVMARMTDMVGDLKGSASTVIKLDTLPEIVNQPEDLIEMKETGQEVMTVEEEETLDPEAEIEGGDLQARVQEVTREKEMTEEVEEMTETEELEEDLQVQEVQAQEVHQDVKITREIEVDQKATPPATPIMTVEEITPMVMIERAVDRGQEVHQQEKEAPEVDQRANNLDKSF